MDEAQFIILKEVVSWIKTWNKNIKMRFKIEVGRRYENEDEFADFLNSHHIFYLNFYDFYEK